MYLATINILGYLPQDDDPPVFDTAREAWAYLAEERRRVEDDYPEWGGSDYSDTYDDLQVIANIKDLENASEEWLEASGLGRNGTGTVYGATPGYDGNHDLGLAYCVTVAEEC